MERAFDLRLNHRSVVVRELAKRKIAVFEGRVLRRHDEAVPLLLLVANSVFLDEDALSEVLQKVQSEFVELVVDLLAKAFSCIVRVELGAPLKSVAVLVAETIESLDFVVAGAFNLIKKDFSISQKSFGAASDRCQIKVAVFEVLKFVNSVWLLADNPLDEVVLHINLRLQQLNARPDEVLKPLNNRIFGQVLSHLIEVISSCDAVTFRKAFAVES